VIVALQPTPVVHDVSEDLRGQGTAEMDGGEGRGGGSVQLKIVLIVMQDSVLRKIIEELNGVQGGVTYRAYEGVQGQLSGQLGN
jgi:hypothetical protein